jgi:ribosomal protein S18 acetylase RimI-like enzyme
MSESIRDKIELRSWRESDFDGAVQLNKDAESGLGIPPETGSWETDMLGIKEIFLDSGGDFLVGYIDDKLVVMGGYKILDSHSAEVKRMRVSPELHRKGLGSWMLGALEDRMSKKGIKTSFVSTLNAQEAALGLYVHNGYQETGRKPGSGVEKRFEIVSFKKDL